MVLFKQQTLNFNLKFRLEEEYRKVFPSFGFQVFLKEQFFIFTWKKYRPYISQKIY